MEGFEFEKLMGRLAVEQAKPRTKAETIALLKDEAYWGLRSASVTATSA